MKRRFVEQGAIGMSCERGSCIQSSFKTVAACFHIWAYFWKRNAFRWLKNLRAWVGIQHCERPVSYPHPHFLFPEANHNSSLPRSCLSFQRFAYTKYTNTHVYTHTLLFSEVKKILIFMHTYDPQFYINMYVLYTYYTVIKNMTSLKTMNLVLV